MSTVTRGSTPVRPSSADSRRALRDAVIVTLGGQLERALGALTSLSLRWWLDPSRLGVYTGLRLFLDQTNRSSLGVGLGAVQEVPLLRAAGREAEARHVVNVAHTTNSLTCVLYATALVLLAWWWAPSRAGDPLAAEWTWGLVAVAALAIVKRYETFLIAVLRAHQEFALTTRTDIVESLVSAVATTVGLWLAGFWGLLGAVGVILVAKILYVHTRHPLRFGWAWDWPVIVRLLGVGLPILANTAAFGILVNLDRVLILALLPDGARAVGLYTIALMGAGWGLDLAGRIVLVLYPWFQTALGRGGDRAEVAGLAMRATEAQALLLGAGGAAAYLLGPSCLGALMPRYAAGLPALRPLLPGMILLGLSWPARQFLITVGRPYRLCLATLGGLALSAESGVIGARWGLSGVAAGMSIGFAGVHLLTSAVAFPGLLGGRAWARHNARVALVLAWCLAGAVLLEPPTSASWHEWLASGLGLAVWLCVPLGILARRLTDLDRRRSRRPWRSRGRAADFR